MNAQDLFAAIGGVESTRLERSELTVQSSRTTQVEETNMYQSKKSRTFRSVLTAALIAAMLATTAFAATGYLLFDSPRQMIDTLFGNETGYDSADWSVPDYKGDVAAELHTDRAPVEAAAAETLVPQTVNQSMTWSGHTLTVDANLYDPVTKCGFVTYTIENPDGLREYAVQPNGEVWFPQGELLYSNQYGRSYIIQDKCTPEKLCATYYYRMQNPNADTLELGLTFWAAIANPETDDLPDSVSDSPETITVPTNSGAALQTVSFGKSTLAPFSLMVCVPKIAEGDCVGELSITFRDGTEYVVENENTLNYLFSVVSLDGTQVIYLLNRLVDVQEVASITIDGEVIPR